MQFIIIFFLFLIPQLILFNRTGMQKFFFVASQTHKKCNCSKGSTCKVEQFIEELDKSLAADNDYEECGRNLLKLILNLKTFSVFCID